MLNIDGKEINLRNFDFEGFEKATSVSQAYSSYKSDNIKFSKKGSELKGTLYTKKYLLEQQKVTCVQKLVAIKKELGESKSGSREGQVENVENNMDYALPHDNVKEMTDEEKVLYNEYRQHLYKLKETDEDLKMIQTLLDNLEDAKTYTLSLEQMNTIQKGDIASEFHSYGEKQITFNKTGKDIKEKLSAKKTTYEAMKITLTPMIAKLISTLKEKGHEPINDGNKIIESGGINVSDYPTFSYTQYEKYGNETNTDYVDDDECREMIKKYNNYVYKLQEVERDVKVIDIMLNNMKDKGNYKLNIRQLATLEKAGKNGKNDIDSILTKAKEPISKVEKVMKEFKAGTLKTSAGVKVTDKKQAVAIAMSEAGLSKADFKSIQKTLSAWDDYNYDVEGRKGEEETTEKGDSLKKAFDELGNL